MLRLLLVELGGANFQISTSAFLLLPVQRIGRLVAVSRAIPNVPQAGDKPRITIAYNKPSFPQPKNTLASCLASW